MKKFNTRGLVFLAMLTALSIVFARLLSITIDPKTLRIGLTNVPVILASLWFGPVAGMFVGFSADFLGATFLSPFGWNPLLAPTSIIIGLLPALLKKAFMKEYGFMKLTAITLIANAFSTIAYSTFALAKMGNLGYSYVLGIRLPAYVIVALLEAVCIYYLYKSGLEKILFKEQGEWYKR